MENELREQLAALAHEQWRGWMEYLFKCGTPLYGGAVELPAWAVDRWKRQMRTPYADLPEDEKQSDRTEADKVLAIVTAQPTKPWYE